MLHYESNISIENIMNYFNNKLPHRILAIDPAIGSSGWSILDLVSIDPLQVNIVKTGFIDGKKLLAGKKESVNKFGSQWCTVDALDFEYRKLINEYKPDQIVSESAFGHLHLAVLVSLTLIIQTVRRASIELLGKDICTVAPRLSKRAWTGSGNADKDLMRLAYQTNKYLNGVVPDNQISEHAIDSVSHGCCYIRVYIVKDIQPTSNKSTKAKKREKEKSAAEDTKKKTQGG